MWRGLVTDALADPVDQLLGWLRQNGSLPPDQELLLAALRGEGDELQVGRGRPGRTLNADDIPHPCGGQVAGVGQQVRFRHHPELAALGCQPVRQFIVNQRAVGDDQRQVAEVRRRDRGLLGQATIRPDEEPPTVVDRQREGVVLGGANGRRHNPQFQQPLVQMGLDVLTVGIIEMVANVRVAVVEGDQLRNQDPGHLGLDAADPDGPRQVVVADGGHHLVGLVELGQDAANPGLIRIPGLSEVHPPPFPGKQGRPQLGFELLDLPAEGRLRDVQLPRRPGDGPLLGNG